MELLSTSSNDAYYANLEEKDVTYNKQFWETIIKPMLSDKIK